MSIRSNGQFLRIYVALISIKMVLAQHRKVQVQLSSYSLDSLKQKMHLKRKIWEHGGL